MFPGLGILQFTPTAGYVVAVTVLSIEAYSRKAGTRVERPKASASSDLIASPKILPEGLRSQSPAEGRQGAPHPVQRGPPLHSLSLPGLLASRTVSPEVPLRMSD